MEFHSPHIHAFTFEELPLVRSVHWVSVGEGKGDESLGHLHIDCLAFIFFFVSTQLHTGCLCATWLFLCHTVNMNKPLDHLDTVEKCSFNLVICKKFVFYYRKFTILTNQDDHVFYSTNFQISLVCLFMNFLHAT